MTPGTYRHFKGKLYTVIGTAVHTEIKQMLVIYTDEKGQLWARPKTMFEDNVEHEGKTVPRFILEQ